MRKKEEPNGEPAAGGISPPRSHRRLSPREIKRRQRSKQLWLPPVKKEKRLPATCRRAFAIGFICALMVMGLVWGLATADSVTRRAGLSENPPLADAGIVEGQAYVSLLGEEFVIPGGWREDAARLGQAVFCLLPPSLQLRAKLLTLQWDSCIDLAVLFGRR